MGNSRHLAKIIIALMSIFVFVTAASSLVIDGDLAVEMKWDSKTKPDRNLFNWTQLGIAFKSSENSDTVRAYFPLYLKGRHLALTDTSEWYIATDEIGEDQWRKFYGSDYFFVVKGTPLSASITNRRIYEDQDYSFQSFGDPLGVFIAPNSHQPIVTARIGGELGKYSFSIYRIYDQPVQYLPVYEELPSGVGELALEEGKIGDYLFRQEMADYTLGQLSTQWGPVGVTFLYGDKLIDNPGFLSLGKTVPVYYKPDATRRLGIWQRNQGFVISGRLPGGGKAEAQYLASQQIWREYTGTHLVDGRSMPKWDVVGENSDQAGYLSVSDLKLGPAQLGLTYRIVGKEFAPVAARHPDYAYGYFNQLPGDFTSPLTYRAIPDRQLLYTRQTEGSAVIDGLGLQTLVSTFTLPLSVLGKESLTRFDYVENRLASPEDDKTFMDQLSKDVVVREFRELDLLWSLKDEDGLEVQLALGNRQYFAEADYLRTATASVSRDFSLLKPSLMLGIAQRARSAQILPGETESSCASGGKLLSAGLKVSTDKLGLKLTASSEYRHGTYEPDLSLVTADRIFPEPYQLLISKLSVGKNYSWQRASGTAKIEAALELVQRAGKAEAPGLTELLGLGRVAYLGLSFPWSSSLRQEMVVVSASGADQAGFPNQYVESAWHNELVWSFDADSQTALRVGYTVMPGQDGGATQNLYAVLGGKVGWANWSLTLGKGTLREFTEQPYVLAGQWQGPTLDPGTAIAGKPWEAWYSGNVAFGNKETLSDVFTLRFWYSF